METAGRRGAGSPRPARRSAPRRRGLTHWLRHLETHARLARLREDPEDVHQVRVAARRLRAALELQGRRALVGDLRALCRDLGPARDLHLAAEVPPLAAWAREETARLRPLVLAALRTPRTRGLLAALRHLPPGPGPAARRELARRERGVRRALRQLERAGAERAAALHRLRRQVRRLRYAREALGRSSRQLAEVQDGLGAFCDLLALRALLARWATDTGADGTAALARLDRALLSAPASPAPPPPPGSPARPPARSRGARRAPSPSAS